MEKRIAELETLLTEYKDAECRAVKAEGEALKHSAELEAAIRRHRDLFGHDNKALDWTTEDETLWAMVQEKPK